jgi:hypothetical protein
MSGTILSVQASCGPSGMARQVAWRLPEIPDLRKLVWLEWRPDPGKRSPQVPDQE